MATALICRLPALLIPLVSTKVAALIGRGREASGSAHFFPIPELPPAEKFLHVHPGPIRSDRSEAQQLPHFFDRGAAVVFERLLSVTLQFQDRCV